MRAALPGMPQVIVMQTASDMMVTLGQPLSCLRVSLGSGGSVCSVSDQ